METWVWLSLALGTACQFENILNEDVSQCRYQSAVMNNHSTKLKGLYDVTEVL